MDLEQRQIQEDDNRLADVGGRGDIDRQGDAKVRNLVEGGETKATKDGKNVYQIVTTFTLSEQIYIT